MHLLDTITIILAGLMVGNELAVSAFFNPAIWKLENAQQALATSLLARSLGRVMPIWYGLCLAFLALESFMHRRQSALPLLLTAALLLVFVIVFSITMLVPINNRIASLNTAALTLGWKDDSTRWDSLHRIRILLLVIAFLALAYALTA